MTVYIKPADLRSYASNLMTGAGAAEHEAELVAESLVASNLCGHDSHGVMRVLEYSVQMRDKSLIPNAELKTLMETTAAFAGDAQFGFGQVQMSRCIDKLIPKAKEQGIACGTLRSCGHLGRLGEWAEKVADRGCAVWLTVNDNGVLRCVAPPGGKEPRVSTNPVGIAVPTSQGPLVLDFSTSVVANGKVRVKMLSGEQCPPGWLLDAEGQPTTDPRVRFTDPRGTILPLGGEMSFKGFGFSLLLDMLIGGLSGGFCPPAPDGARLSNNVLMVVWDPQRWAGTEHFLGEIDKLIASVRETPRVSGVDVIRLPGDRSRSLRTEREQNGVPLDEGTWRELSRLAQRFQVAVPDPIGKTQEADRG
ncbi:MAG: Ldh family oxidoreductase [Planctomycetota bacterium]|nr:Ldh family oxidoreductase [Planctomycetota bacterium]